MAALFDRFIFGGQAKRIPSHRVQDRVARHASVAADYVCGNIVAPVSHRQPFAGRVGEEIQTVELVLAWFRCAIHTPLLPDVPPFRLYRVRIVFAAFDLSPVFMESSYARNEKGPPLGGP